MAIKFHLQWFVSVTVDTNKHGRCMIFEAGTAVSHLKGEEDIGTRFISAASMRFVP